MNIANSVPEDKTEQARDFAYRLRVAMARADMDVNALSESTDISKPVIWSYRRGDRVPTLINLALICDALDVSVEELLERRKG